MKPAEVFEFLPNDLPSDQATVYCKKTALASLGDQADHATIQLLDETDLPLLASQVISGPSINFLQGSFAPKTQLIEKIRPWRLAASLLLAVLLTVFARDVLRLQQIKSVRHALDQQMAGILTTTCPGQTRIVNPLNQLLSCTGGNAIAASTYFLETLSVVSAALPRDLGIRILSISFADQSMELRLNVPDVATLDNIQREVNESEDFSAEIQSTSQEENRVEGRIQIHRSEDQA
ncbi:hypothetical protein MnTg04_00703 [bacterium MnTg04]|nr:hypothetical protein MnTg04_00703 [bacterium MnTg04]